ncbi:MAG TPA: hypothetical protein VHV10_20550 [Ktedonobacteraceae bacterium]|nr:hypothetical protein [Ktedonobacteraceae bacterium]
MKDNATFWHASDDICIQRAIQSFEEEGKAAATIRHYYYKMLSSDVLRVFSKFETSKKNAYNWVSGLLTKARDNGDFPWAAVVDNGRRSKTYWWYDDLDYYVSIASLSGYSLDPWRGQSCRIEIIVEKDGLVDMVSSYVEQWRIPVRSLDGFNSTTKSKQAAQRYGTGKGYILFCCGDFDPSGILIPQSLKKKLNQYGSHPDIRRLALVKEDTLQLPDYAAVEVSNSNPHRVDFQRLYGKEQKGYEIEVLTPTQLRRRVEGAVAPYINEAAFKAALELEKAVRSQFRTKLENAVKGGAEEIYSNGIPDIELSRDAQLRYLA